MAIHESIPVERAEADLTKAMRDRYEADMRTARILAAAYEHALASRLAEGIDLPDAILDAVCPVQLLANAAWEAA